jgi:hypothetical protein
MKTLLLIIFKLLELFVLVSFYSGACYLSYSIFPKTYVWYNPIYFLATLGIAGTGYVSGLLIYILIKAIPKWIELNKHWVDKILD